MLLDALDKSRGNIKVCLVQTPSPMLGLFIQDKLRGMFQSVSDTIIDLKTKSDMNLITSVQNVEPLDSIKWLALWDYTTKKTGVKLADIITTAKTSTTVVFLLTVENYRAYKEVKSALKDVDYVYDFYLPYLNKANMRYLYYQIVPKSFMLSPQLYSFVSKSYSGDVESVMTLFKSLASGNTCEKHSDITDICGLGSNTIENFVFTLLKDPPTTEKGLKRILSNRLKAGRELSEVYGFRSFYNFTLSSLKRILDIKQLRISGAVHKKMIQLPNGYDDNHLERYQRYIWQINKIPTTRILRLYFHLAKNKWTNDLEFINSIYGYFFEVISYEVLPNIKFETQEEIAKRELDLAKKALEQQKKEGRKDEKKYRLDLIKKYGYNRAMQMLAEEKETGAERAKIGKQEKSIEVMDAVEDKSVSAENSMADILNLLKQYRGIPSNQ